MMLALRTIISRNFSNYDTIRKIELNGKLPLSNLYSQITQNKQSVIGNRCFGTQSNPKDDNVQLQRIYYGSLSSRMKAVKVFSLTTSCVGLAAQPVLMEQGMKIGGTGMAIFLCSFAGIFTFVTPLLLHLITKKYVTEMYYNPATEEYIATTISILLKKVETKFRPSDVKVPEVPGIFTSFIVGKKPMFIDPALFENTDHYVRIMGYDKPIDYKLDLNEDTTTTETKPRNENDKEKQ